MSEAVRGLRSACGRAWRRIRLRGTQRYCPLCRSSLDSFLPHGNPPRMQSVCPVCQGRERHRLAWMYIEAEVLADRRPRRVLHLAPEDSIARRLLAAPGIEYVSGDIRATRGVRLDVHALPFADASFDFVYCSHVLNMVRDDVASLREIGRVLRADGLALVQVPLADAPTTLDGSPGWRPEQRLAAFGDPAIQRRFGDDAADRLGRSGLRVDRLEFHLAIAPDSFERHGLIDEDLLVCTHPARESRQ
jgi:SAM-dependent methyltransferase